MRIGVANVQVPFVRGGAEIHAETLIDQLRLRGFEAELITVPFKWYPSERLIDSIAIARTLDLSEANGRPIDRLIALKFPIYLTPHPYKILWVLHQYRSAYDLWDHPQFGDLIHQPFGQAVREAIKYADETFIPEAKAVYANSLNVANRLATFNGISAQPLYHPPANADLFFSGEAEHYLFYPSRITPLKRQKLVVQALARCSQPVRVMFAGPYESEAYEQELKSLVSSLGLQDRAVFRGYLSEVEKRSAYAHAAGIVFPPVDEDYGYITLEAMLSAKPVITTVDSGGPTEFVQQGVTGIICEPEPAAMADAMDRFWADPAGAKRMGANGREYYDSLNISWDHVIEVLTTS